MAHLLQQGIPLQKGNSLLTICSQFPATLCPLTDTKGPDLNREVFGGVFVLLLLLLLFWGGVLFLVFLRNRSFICFSFTVLVQKLRPFRGSYLDLYNILVRVAW